MADIELAVRTLLSLAGGAAIQRPDGSSKVLPLYLPDGESLPALVYQRIATPPEGLTHSGGIGYEEPTFQVTVHHNTYLSTRQLAKLLTNYLVGYKGVVAGVRIDKVEKTGDTDQQDPDTNRWSAILQYDFTHGVPT